MANAVNLMQSLVSISQFNRGQATKIFDRLHSERGKITVQRIDNRQCCYHGAKII